VETILACGNNLGMWKQSWHVETILACGNNLGMWNELIKNQLVDNFFKIISQATRLRKRMEKYIA